VTHEYDPRISELPTYLIDVARMSGDVQSLGIDGTAATPVTTVVEMGERTYSLETAP
jgi:hypothetical protein